MELVWPSHMWLGLSFLGYLSAAAGLVTQLVKSISNRVSSKYIIFIYWGLTSTQGLQEETERQRKQYVCTHVAKNSMEL